MTEKKASAFLPITDETLTDLHWLTQVDHLWAHKHLATKCDISTALSREEGSDTERMKNARNGGMKSWVQQSERALGEWKKVRQQVVSRSRDKLMRGRFRWSTVNNAEGLWLNCDSEIQGRGSREKRKLGRPWLQSFCPVPRKNMLSH